MGKFNRKGAVVGALGGVSGSLLGSQAKNSGEGLLLQDVPGIGPAPELARFQGFTQTLRGQAPSEFEALARQRALDQGISPETARAIDFNRATAQGGAASSMSSLARAGGLSSGSRERLLGAAAQQGTLGSQEAMFQGQQAQREMQNQLMNLEEERNRIDLQNAFSNNLVQNQYNLQKYDAENQRYIGELQMQRAAQDAANQERMMATRGGLLGSGGFLGSGFRFGG